MQNRLIIFYGASPGAGKSTLSSFLFEQLTLHGLPARWIYEEDILHLDTFASSIQHIQNGNQHQILPSLLKATADFVQECLASEGTTITDSIFPCFNWLIATNYYSTSQMEAFSHALELTLAPLNPLIIYLDIDSEIGVKRATQQRGQQWYDDMRVRIGQYLYNQNKNIRSLKDVASYFDMANRYNKMLLSKWSGDTLIFNVTQFVLDQLKTKILQHLDLSPKQNQTAIHTSDLVRYIGIYQSSNDDTPITNPIKIDIADDLLTINTYWPNGSPLIPFGPGQFRLKNTSHRIEFEYETNHSPKRFTYHASGKKYRYEMLPS